MKSRLRRQEEVVAEDELLESNTHPSYTLVLILLGAESLSAVRVGETLKGTAKG